MSKKLQARFRKLKKQQKENNKNEEKEPTAGKKPVKAKNEYVRNLITELKDIEKGEIKSASVKLDEVSVEKFIKLVQLNVPSHKLALETDNGKLYMLNEITIAKLVKGLAYESELNDEELNYMKTMDLSFMTKNLKLKIIESKADIPDRRYSYKKTWMNPP